jgi:hypothetical protein
VTIPATQVARSTPSGNEPCERWWLRTLPRPPRKRLLDSRPRGGEVLHPGSAKMPLSWVAG